MVRRSAAFLAVALLLALGLAWPAGDRSLAQDAPTDEEATEVPPTVEPTATPSAYPLRSLTFTLLAQTDISVTTTGPVTVSAATITILPGAASVSFVTEGDTVISPSTGTVSLQADQVVLGVADIGSSIGLDTIAGTPEAVDTVILATGGQAYLPAGTTASVRNDTEAAAVLLILTILPAS